MSRSGLALRVPGGVGPLFDLGVLGGGCDGWGVQVPVAKVVVGVPAKYRSWVHALRKRDERGSHALRGRTSWGVLARFWRRDVVCAGLHCFACG